MARFVDAHEAVIPILTNFAILYTVNYKWRITSCAKFSSVSVIEAEGDGLAAKPIADIVSIAVVHSYADGVVKNRFQVCEEVGVSEVACLLEGVVDIVIGICVVQIDSEGGLGRSKI